MGYKREELIKKALNIAEKDKLCFLADVIAGLGIGTQTFYNHKLEQLEELKSILESNRIEIKKSLRKKWFDSKNATLQLALYKLLADQDELKRLSVEFKDHTTNGEKISINLVKADGD